jgi:polygalacturonase
MNSRREFLRQVAAFGALSWAGEAVYNVRDHGAAADGLRAATKSIQAAIDVCAATGGGRVYFPPGRYLSGTIFLKSGVHLYLEAGAALLGSQALADYPETVSAFRSYTDNYTDKSLIYGEQLENVGIGGPGTLDGQGAAFKGPYKVRPYMLRLIECRRVLVENVAFVDSPMWVQHYLACDDVHLQGIRVRSRCNENNDGIDIDCCSRVRISDCDISSGDDAIVLKSTAGRPCSEITITNCVLSTLCNALKLGTESNGGFQNVVVSNCTVYDTRLAGIAVELVDGGALERVSFSGITMKGVGTPLFIRLGDRGRPFKSGMDRSPVGSLRDVTIRDVIASGGGVTGSSITGLPGHPVENVTLDNVRLGLVGGGKEGDARKAVEELPANYPEFSMFGKLPAYGIYCRHARNLALRNVETRCEQSDARPALVCDDVEDLTIGGGTWQVQENAGPAIRLIDVRRALVRDVRTTPGVRTPVRVEGTRSSAIDISGSTPAP